MVCANASPDSRAVVQISIPAKVPLFRTLLALDAPVWRPADFVTVMISRSFLRNGLDRTGFDLKLRCVKTETVSSLRTQ